MASPEPAVPYFTPDDDDALPLPAGLVGDGDFFVLRVWDDSMIEAAICDGDFVVVRRQPTAESGEIVAAVVDGETTVKVLDVAGGRLLSRSPHYPPIDSSGITLLGRVVTVLRRLR